MKITEFETFLPIGTYRQSELTKREPFCFNAMIHVEKYKVIVEQIKEPKEIIYARIQKLWEECNNYHNWYCIKTKAKQYNYELKGQQGTKRKRFL